jgi:YVTN family beta-propeller protein
MVAVATVGFVSPKRIRRTLGALAVATLGLSSLTAQAQTVIFQENFNNGLGRFTAVGSVSTTAGNALIRGSLNGTDGAITSAQFSTAGFSSLSLSFDRTTSGLDLGEVGVAEVSVNGGAFTAIESVRIAASRATFALGANVANQANVVLRFRIASNSVFENYTVDNITLTGVGNGQPNPGNNNRPAIGDFVTFESGQVRPLAVSADGQRLYAVNTPDNRVEVFDVSTNTPTRIESIAVGLEPVAVAFATPTQLWVVNHLSDSVSILDVSSSPARLINTLNVGDEPRDLVFGGNGNRWAFITAAHRGQNAPFNPQLTTPGLGRADVWVFDAAAPGAALGGTPVTILNMFGDTLRGLARNADGSRIYAAVLNSGNRTTVLTDDIGAGGIQKAPPFTSADGVQQPQTGLIVKFNGQDWVDSGDPVTGTAPQVFTPRVKLNLPDFDVFTIDASGSAPVVSARTTGVGTTLFNLAVNPRNGNVYVSNLEALNLTRFEGPGSRSSTVRGHFVESRITVINGTTAAPRHLNKHITSYNSPLGTDAERALSLFLPLEMAVSNDGNNMFVAAMGSNKLARFATTQLENNTFTPAAANQLLLTGGGPTGVVLDEARNRAFVLTRFDNGISVVDTQQFTEVAHLQMFNPEPARVINGRRFLYDGTLTSSRGDSACAGCHIFGDVDHLSWDLGVPDERVAQSPNAYNVNIPAFLRQPTFHPMKGPMTTQSFRGLKRNGPLHWRGDRTGVTRAADETLEEQAFEDFNVAFTSLNGRAAQLTAAEMDAFAKFVLELTYPPNPIANLDNTLTAVQAQGAQIYNTVTSDNITQCNGCHVLNRPQGRFGTDGTMSFEGNGVDEDFKIPHLRNMYAKVGMFARNTQVRTAPSFGDQIRGFGFDNSGASGSVFDFLSSPVFTINDDQTRMVEQFVLAFASDMNPIVGQQVTVTPANAARTDVRNRLNLLVQRALVTTPVRECEVVAKAVIQNRAAGWVMNSAQAFVPDDANAPAVSLTTLLNQAAAALAPITFTCVPPGNGTRVGVDRDADNILDSNDTN